MKTSRPTPDDDEPSSQQSVRRSKDAEQKMTVKAVNPKAQSKANAAPPVPDANQMKLFIKFLHRKACAWLQTYSKEPHLKPKGQSFAGSLTIAIRDRLLTANASHMNVSVAINHIEGNKRVAANVTRINALCIDDDDGRVSKAILLKLPLPPDMIVVTSPGHLHAYWRVRDCKVPQFPVVQKALAKKFGTDASISDPARVMRMPGSINWKHNEPYRARIVHQLKRKPVSLATLVKKLKLDLETVAAVEPTVRVTATSKKSTEVAPAVPALGDTVVAKIRAALKRLEAHDRTLWLRVGMSIHSAAPTDEGYQLWAEWSKDSDKYEESDQRTTWQGFKLGGGINIGTLYWLASHTDDSPRFDAIKLGSLFVENYRGILRFDASAGYWYLFKGVVWVQDRQAPLRLAKALVEDLSVGNGLKEGELNAFRNPGGLSQIERMAALDDERIGITDGDFDKDHDLFAVKNGVVRLSTSQFRSARPKDLLRRCATVEFDAEATCPLWDKFIAEVTKGDESLAQFLRRAVGYTLHGHTKAQVFFVIEGSGSNGKGAFLRMLSWLLGQYAAELAPNLMTSAYSGNANSSSSALVALKGIRLGVVTELPNKRGFDTAFVKQFSGGDSITARANYGDSFTFKPEGKLWVSTNNMPEIAANDKAMWRRLMPIPFLRTFTINQRDEDLETKLFEEGPGILNWALAGAKEYAKCGKLGSCEAVDAHRARLRKESDVVGRWLKDHCKPVKNGSVQSSLAYASYSAYSKRLGKLPLPTPAFGARMEREGFPRKETKKFNCFMGVELKTES